MSFPEDRPGEQFIKRLPVEPRSTVSCPTCGAPSTVENDGPYTQFRHAARPQPDACPTAIEEARKRYGDDWAAARPPAGDGLCPYCDGTGRPLPAATPSDAARPYPDDDAVAALRGLVDALSRMPDVGREGEPRYQWWWDEAVPAMNEARATLDILDAARPIPAAGPRWHEGMGHAPFDETDCPYCKRDFSEG